MTVSSGAVSGVASTVRPHEGQRIPAPRVDASPVDVPAPPDIPRSTPPPLFQRILPIVLVLVVGGVVVWTVMSGGIRDTPMSLLFPVMMIVSMGAMMGATRGGSTSAELRELRREFLHSLGVVRERLVEVASQQRRAARHVHPAPMELAPLVGTRRMWERLPGDADWLTVPLGVGRQRCAAPIEVPDVAVTTDAEPVSVAATRALVAAHSVIDDIPVAIGLEGFGIVAIAPESPQATAQVADLARALVAHLAVFHAPTVLSMVGVLSSSQEGENDEALSLGGEDVLGTGMPGHTQDHARQTLRYEIEQMVRTMSWFPHARAAGAVTTSLAQAVAAVSERERGRESVDPDVAEISPRVSDCSTGKDSVPSAALVVVPPAHASGIEPELVAHRPEIAILCVTPSVEHAISEAARAEGLLLLVSSEGELSALTGSGREELGRCDALSDSEFQALALRMAGFQSPKRAGETTLLRRTPTYPEVLGLTPEALDAGLRAVRQRRRARGESDRLAVILGHDDDGEPVRLDLKEAAHGGVGPHGLCIGATGSGKSELLRTIVTGLLATHSSEELNFVLVDFKGGATFLGMDAAPHVAAVITNLAAELTLVDRMRDAVTGEMRRRQELLRAAGNFPNVDAYEAARVHRPDLPALPALLIVVDEFSELLAERPEFVDLFGAVGRLGRSLHMHLLLASQRLEEGRLRGLDSHLSYRIGLKTFSSGESRVVLGIPDAYSLPSRPGMGYLKTPDAPPHRFRAAYVSGTLVAPVSIGDDLAVSTTSLSSNRTVDPSDSISVCDPTGARVASISLASARSVASSLDDLAEDSECGALPRRAEERAGGSGVRPGETLVEAVVRLSEGSGPEAHRVWLPPLPPTIALSDVRQGQLYPDDAAATGTSALTGEATVPTGQSPIGVLDEPDYQRRRLATVGLSQGHWAIVGAPGSGTSAAMMTFLVSLCTDHSPNELAVYVLDTTGALAAAASLPHVGAVAGRRDSDLHRRIMAVLRAEVERRLAAGSDGHPRRRLLVAIDGLAALRAEHDDIDEFLAMVAADGLAAGVHLVLSANRWPDLKPQVREAMGGTIELRLGDPSDSIAGRRAAQTVPAMPGRGITADGTHLLVATTTTSAEIADSNNRWADYAPVDPIELLPAVAPAPAVGANHLSRGADILCGLRESDLTPWSLAFAEDHHVLVFGDECGKTSLLRLLGLALTRNPEDSMGKTSIITIDYRRAHLGERYTDTSRREVAGYAATPDAARQLLGGLAATLRERLPGADITPRDLRRRSWWSGPEVYLFVDDYDLVAADGVGGPLASLGDLLPYSEDIGLHVVLVRRCSGAARALFDPVIHRLRDCGATVVLMSGDREEGPLVGGLRPRALPPGRGVVLRRGDRPEAVQLYYASPTGVDGEDTVVEAINAASGDDFSQDHE